MGVLKFFISIFYILFSFNVYGQSINDDHPLLDKEAPLFKEMALNNELLDLELLKGKVILINFWSLSCAACFKEIPELNELVERYSSDDFVLISVMSDSRDKIKERMEVMDNFYRLKRPVFDNDIINYQVIPDGLPILQAYSDRVAFPQFFIVDSDGIINYYWYGYAEPRGIPGEITTHKILISRIDKLIPSQ